jgi:hypothetical protein
MPDFACDGPTARVRAQKIEARAIRERKEGFIRKKRFRKVAESLQKARKPRRIGSFVAGETIGWAEHSKNEPFAAGLHAAFVPL